MNKKLIIDEIKILNEVINDQINSITNYSDLVPVIEIDILLDNIKKLYQSIKEFEKDQSNFINKNITVVNNVKDNELSFELNGKIENAQVTINEENKSITADNIKIIEDIVDKKNVIATTPNLFTRIETDERPDDKQYDARKKKNQNLQKQTIDLFAETNNKKTIADKYKDDKKSLNEIIAKDANNETIGAKMQKTPISDLRTAIRINEKFLFINNLFDGDMQDYNNFIEILNNKNNLKEAKDFIKSIQEERSWNIYSESYLMLMDLIYRRFNE